MRKGASGEGSVFLDWWGEGARVIHGAAGMFEVREHVYLCFVLGEGGVCVCKICYRGGEERGCSFLGFLFIGFGVAKWWMSEHILVCNNNDMVP